MIDFDIDLLSTRQMTDFEDDPDTQDLLCEPNWEKTKELQK